MPDHAQPDRIQELKRLIAHEHSAAILDRQQGHPMGAKKHEAQAREYELALERLVGRKAAEGPRGRFLRPGNRPWQKDGPPPRRGPVKRRQHPEAAARAAYIRREGVQVADPPEVHGEQARLTPTEVAGIRRSVGPFGSRAYNRRIAWLRHRIRTLTARLSTTKLGILRHYYERHLARRRAELRVLLDMGPQGLVGLIRADQAGKQAARAWSQEQRRGGVPGRSAPPGARGAAGGFAPIAVRAPPDLGPGALQPEPGRRFPDRPIPGMGPDGPLPELPYQANDPGVYTPQTGDQEDFIADKDSASTPAADASASTTPADASADQGSTAADGGGGMSVWWWVGGGLLALIGVGAAIKHGQKSKKGGGSASSSSSSSKRSATSHGYEDDYLMNRGRSSSRSRRQRRHGRRRAA